MVSTFDFISITASIYIHMQKTGNRANNDKNDIIHNTRIRFGGVSYFLFDMMTMRKFSKHLIPFFDLGMTSIGFDAFCHNLSINRFWKSFNCHSNFVILSFKIHLKRTSIQTVACSS